MSTFPAGSSPDDHAGTHAGGVGFLQLFMEASARIERTDSRDTAEGVSPDRTADEGR